MDIKVRSIRDFLEIEYSDNNLKYETGLLDKREYSDLVKKMLSEVLYYADEGIYEFILDEYKGDFESLGFSINKDD